MHGGKNGFLVSAAACNIGRSLSVYALVYVNLNYAAGERGVDMFRNVISGIAWGQYCEVFLYTVMAACGGLLALAVTRDTLIDWLLGARLWRRASEGIWFRGECLGLGTCRKDCSLMEGPSYLSRLIC